MRVAFPVSLPTIKKVDVSPVEIVFDPLVRIDEDYRDFASACVAGPTPVAQFGGRFELDDLVEVETVVAWGMDMVEVLRGNGRKVDGVIIHASDVDLLDWSAKYDEACNDDSIKVIVVTTSSLDGLDRLRFFRKLVDAQKFCGDKSHWLYGVPNPAELGVYKELFSSYVNGKIHLAISSTCFIYSMYGIEFSSTCGVLKPIPGDTSSRVLDLGMLTWYTYTPSKEQLRHFYLNVDMVQQFARGKIADLYLDKVYGII